MQEMWSSLSVNTIRRRAMEVFNSRYRVVKHLSTRFLSQGPFIIVVSIITIIIRPLRLSNISDFIVQIFKECCVSEVLSFS